MFDLSEYCTSRAKLRILQLLCRHPTPLPLRQVADLSVLPVFSVQGALADLTKKRIVRREKRDRFACYSLNRRHPDATVLSDLFRWLEERKLRTRASGYETSARNALAFASEAHEIYAAVRKRNRDA